MVEQVSDYICPACGGPMKFDPASGQVKCEYCGSLYSIEEAKAANAAKNQNAAENSVISEDEVLWADGDDDMKAYKCNACGAEMVCDETTSATSCPYCGGPVVIPQQFKGVMRPKYVIPFKVEKSEVKSKLKEYYKGKPLLPGTFSGMNTIDEIKGIYVPFWLYSGTVDADMQFDCEKEDRKKTSTEEIVTTEYYDVHRQGTISFEKIPTDASTKMPDDLMDSIEPYDYKDLVEFEMEYLPGYLAEKYDVTKEDSIERARKRAENTAVLEVEDTVDNYTSVSEKKSVRKIKFSKETQDYAMLPVWMLTTKWNGKNYTFAMNGQTGEMVGDLPIDGMKQIIMLLIWFLIPFAAVWFFAESAVTAAVVGAIIAIVAIIIMRSKMKPVTKGTQARVYRQGGDNALKLNIKTDTFIRKEEKRTPLNKES